MTNPLLYYIRHGQTDWNAEQRYQGQLDIPLNQHGKDQAHRNGEKLRELLGEKPDIPFIASPLIRTRETMEIIQIMLGFDTRNYETDERLIEACYGIWEGKIRSEIKLEFPEMHRQRQLERWTFRMPGGESHHDTHQRVAAWHDTISQDCVVVAHGQVGRALRYHLLTLEPQAAGLFEFPQDRVCIIRKGQEEFK